jgi:hypothetical protein
MLTAFFTTENIEATARRTGFVNRASTMTGQIFWALITCGVWSDATPPLAPLAAKGTQWDEQLEVSPEARSQRRNKRAHACLQDLLSQGLAKVHARDHRWDEGLFPALTKGDLAESTGVELPQSWHGLFPGSGGSAAQAGAKMQAVWDEKHRVFDPFALTPWTMPDQKSVDIVVA